MVTEEVKKPEAVKKPVFYTQDNLPPVTYNDCPNVPVPVMAWNDDRTALVQVGKRDLQAEIQAAAVGLGVYDLLRRAQHGDVTGFDGVPLYGDFTDNPETLSEAKDVVDASEKVKDYLNGQSQQVARGAQPSSSSAASGASAPDQVAEEKKSGSQTSQVEANGGQKQ